MSGRRRVLRAARSALRRLGVEAIRYAPRNFEHLRRAEVLRAGGITVLVDVGAHNGRYALQRRREGFAGRIVSIEPLSFAFAELEQVALRDGAWESYRLALADYDGEAELSIAADATASSLRFQPDRVGREQVPVARLDSLATRILRPDDVAFVKIDAEGHELPILEGASETLRLARAVEVELGFVARDGEAPSLAGVVDALTRAGFRLVALEPSTRDPATGDVLLANALFLR